MSEPAATPPNRYHLVVQHQLSVEQAVSLECFTEDRETAARDARFFIELMTDQHEIARRRAFSHAEKQRDLLVQKLANLQAEEQRLVESVRTLRAEAAGASTNGAAER